MVLALLLSGLPLSAAQDESVHLDNATQCQDGLILSVWQPQHGLSTSEVVLRGIVYFLSLIFMFLGVSIISDRFMSAIEVITSSERKIKVKKKDGTEQTVTVRVWNETVANLTLMALGSSAPEILLSIIEIYAKNFTAGDLGPGTIVGSAAYNLFVIISLCVYVVPDGEVRKIKHLRVFFVTATWSVFAYIWLYLILAVISEGVVEVWEGILTFLFFPATVLTAYMADRSQSHSFKSLRLNRNRVIVAAESGEINMAMEPEEEILEDSKDPESLADTLRMLKKENPGMSMDELERLAQERIMANLPKSRAFYRVQASRMLTGSHHSKISIREDSNQKIAPAPEGTQVFFRPQYYTVLENIGSFDVTVAREVADEKALRDTVKVDFTTEDGTAVAGSDYVGASGTIVFQPGEAEQRITLQIIDDDVFEENEHFYVHLTKARTVGGEGVVNLGQPATAVVMILDDDHCGSFGFADPKLETAENVGELKVTVYRSSGARGAVDVPFYTQNGTAKYGDHYGELTGVLHFQNNETQKTISIPIVEENSYQKRLTFYVQLEEPIKPNDKDRSSNHDLNVDEQIALQGKPSLGAISRLEVTITESNEFKNTVDKLVSSGPPSTIENTSWGQQFSDACKVLPDDDSDGEPATANCFDYVLHFLTLFWKLLFATVPPPGIFSGYVCFVISIIWIGVLTALIGDIASHFGCTVGLKDSVTAVTLVALGTSVPDQNDERSLRDKMDEYDEADPCKLKISDTRSHPGFSESLAIENCQNALNTFKELVQVNDQHAHHCMEPAGPVECETLGKARYGCSFNCWVVTSNRPGYRRKHLSDVILSYKGRGG
nr:PREDICTED: sodium/calcium exchanger 1 isoform X2 [Bemisia tabaci]